MKINEQLVTVRHFIAVRLCLFYFGAWKQAAPIFSELTTRCFLLGDAGSKWFEGKPSSLMMQSSLLYLTNNRLCCFLRRGGTPFTPNNGEISPRADNRLTCGFEVKWRRPACTASMPWGSWLAHRLVGSKGAFTLVSITFYILLLSIPYLGGLP